MNKVLELYPPKHNPVFRNKLVTVVDLQAFKTEILLGIQQLLTENKPNFRKKWLKTYEVKTLLGVSSGTLLTLRTNGTLPYTKIGSIIYYNIDDIEKLRFSAEIRTAKIIKIHT
jgi:hypothetical protein